MKESSQVSGFIAFLTIIALTATPFLATAGTGMTTADLALRLAQAAGIKLAPVDSPRAALVSLARVGIYLGNDLEAPVTEQVLVEVGQALGVKVTTARPDAVVTMTVGRAFVASFKRALQGATDPVNAACQGRESRDDRKGTPASPSDPNATAEPCGDSAPQP